MKCFHTPCHTKGHILYYVDFGDSTETHSEAKDAQNKVEISNLNRAVFTGDTIFIGGCGRFFEGTPKQMVFAFETLDSLPADTKIFCGHEYTVSNYKFAKNFASDTETFTERISVAEEKIGNGLHSIPTTVEEERKSNVFMRTLKETDPESAMKTVREAKDNA